MYNVSNAASMSNGCVSSTARKARAEPWKLPRTVVGTPMAEGDAPLTMRAVDNTGSVYTGTVGGTQDGIPMTIEFTWNLNSDEWIVGDLKSSVTQQGMTCNMTRPFELRYGGG